MTDYFQKVEIIANFCARNAYQQRRAKNLQRKNRLGLSWERGEIDLPTDARFSGRTKAGKERFGGPSMGLGAYVSWCG